jgi:hypothetical protein
VAAAHAVHRLDSKWLGEAYGDDDPSLGIPSGKFKLEDIIGVEDPSHYKRMLRKSLGSQKDDAPREFSMRGVSSRMMAWSAQLQIMSTQRNQVWKEVLI